MTGCRAVLQQHVTEPSTYAGPRADDIRALDYIAADVRAQGRSEAAVGYHTYFAEFMAAINIVDPRYKVGGEYDLFLKHRYGIANSDRCAEGFSPRDDYRIVQRPPLLPEPDGVTVSLGAIGGELKAIHLGDYFDVSPDRFSTWSSGLATTRSSRRSQTNTDSADTCDPIGGIPEPLVIPDRLLVILSEQVFINTLQLR